MSPAKVYERFIQEYPSLESQIVRYFKRRPAHRSEEGADSIRLVFKTGKTMIFKVFKNGKTALEQGGSR